MLQADGPMDGPGGGDDGRARPMPYHHWRFRGSARGQGRAASAVTDQERGEDGSSSTDEDEMAERVPPKPRSKPRSKPKSKGAGAGAGKGAGRCTCRDCEGDEPLPVGEWSHRAWSSLTMEEADRLQVFSLNNLMRFLATKTLFHAYASADPGALLLLHSHLATLVSTLLTRAILFARQRAQNNVLSHHKEGCSADISAVRRLPELPAATEPLLACSPLHTLLIMVPEDFKTLPLPCVSTAFVAKTVCLSL